MMMKKLKFIAAFSLLAVVLFSCKKEEEPYNITEPITFLVPDTTYIEKKAGETQNLSISMLTDRGIYYAQILYEIDSVDTANTVYSYPDTLYYENFKADGKTLNTKHVIFESYTVPDSLLPNDKIRFKASFRAENLFYSKEFLIKVVQ